MPEQQEYFKRLKMAISPPRAIKMADFSKQFILQTDAKGIDVGAFLSQNLIELDKQYHRPLERLVLMNAKHLEFTNCNV